MNNRRMGLLCLVVFGWIIIAWAAGSVAVAALRSGIDLADFDTSVAPGENFFLYVNGNWIKAHPIPPEYAGWGSFAELHDRNLTELREILDNLASDTGPLDPDGRKLRDLYRTATDEAKLQKDGISPLQPELDKVAAVQAKDDLVKELAHLHSMHIDPLFRIRVGQDEKNSARYVLLLTQGGTGLPERNYYVGNDPDSKRIRSLYREHVSKMLGLLGDAPAAADASADIVLSIETRLAEKSRTPVQRRNVEANYNKLTLPELRKLVPNFDWDKYLADLGAPKLDDVIVGQPEFFQRVDELLTSVPMEQWRTYLKWHLIEQTSRYLSDPFANENFRFNGTVFRGTSKMQPRWKRAVLAVDAMMGEALGRLYVQEHFGSVARQRMADLVANIVDSYRDRIRTRDWMSEQTKKQALAKLDSVMRKIGCPDHWRDYSSLQIGTDSYVQNALRADAFDFHYHLSKLGGPVDRSEWGMTPPTVNAYYNASLNEIVFPAGILQPPFFDPGADDAVNYGAIGSIIGHELTHGFDDQGSQFDAAGNIKNWWTKQDKERFDAEASRLAAQFDECVAIDDLHVNGRLTLGENIADLGGVTIAYAAYERSLKGHPAPVIDGFTGEQRFFIGMARMERGHVRPESLRVQVRTNPHSPPQFRVLVPLSDFTPFYDAFHLKPGDKMYRPPDQRVEVW